MNKLVAIVMLLSVMAFAALASASGYGASGYGHGQAASYGQNYDRKTGFKTTIYHPYGGVSNRYDYRSFPAYGGGGYDAYPAPYIKTGLEYTIKDEGYGSGHAASAPAY